MRDNLLDLVCMFRYLIKPYKVENIIIFSALEVTLKKMRHYFISCPKTFRTFQALMEQAPSCFRPFAEKFVLNRTCRRVKKF